MILQKFSSVLLNFMGWKIIGDIPSAGRHVYAFYPHTTIWDGPLCLLVGLSSKKNKKFLIAVKESFDKPILKDICKKINFLPIQRNSSGLKMMLKTLDENKNLNIAVAIEGTRKKSDGVKPGFFIIAKKTHTPVVLGTADWQNKIFTIFESFEVKETFEETVEKIAEILEPMRPLGKYPENESPIKPI